MGTTLHKAWKDPQVTLHSIHCTYHNALNTLHYTALITLHYNALITITLHSIDTVSTGTLNIQCNLLCLNRYKLTLSTPIYSIHSTPIYPLPLQCYTMLSFP